MKSLVTGANGFVGSAVVRCLLEEGAAVRALVRPGSDQRNLEGLGVERVNGDITDPESLRPALRDCESVFHVAADYRLWVPDPRPMYATNVQGSLNVLECAHRSGVARVVYTSSVATLGCNPDAIPANEDTPVSLTDMIGDYKRSKYVAEMSVRKLAAKLDLPTVIVNPSTPIGPGDIRPTPTGRIILDAAGGRMPAYLDTGLNLVHVDDVARGHILALKAGRPGQRYILGGLDMSLKRILEVVADMVGRRPPRVRLPRWPLFPVACLAEGWARLGGGTPRLTLDGLRMSAKHMYFSSAKAERELGYRWRDPQEAIADAIAWFERHGYL